MNKKNDKYMELIERIKIIQPKISNPQRLTLKITQSVECLSQKKSCNKTLTVIFLVSSIAASFLIGLFVCEQFLSPSKTEYKSSNIAPVYMLPASDKNIYIEKSTALIEINNWMRSKHERQKRQKSFYSNIISKYKIL